MAIQNILAVTLLILGFQVSYVSADPIKFERTSASPKKVHLNIPVEFTKQVCREFTLVPFNNWRYNYFPCGFRGRAICSYPFYYTDFRTECIRFDTITQIENRDVILKFRKGTEVPEGEVEEYTVNATQMAFDSNRLYVNVTPIRTTRTYDIIYRGRRVIFKLPKN
ncbi:MAG: hypothetical protein KA715_11660 [Xanthomonadaceae bacterium]|nr:hypothetical protein [Xanthomonadaceae bacterium]